jgi:photosystem II stability/assembly factor-like uncharacterized protein
MMQGRYLKTYHRMMAHFRFKRFGGGALNSAGPRVIFLVCLFTLSCTRGEVPVVAIAINPTHPDVVYLATLDAIYKTRDGGARWKAVNKGMSTYRVLSLMVDPNIPTVLYAGTNSDSVYKSTDGALSWSIANAGMKEHIAIVNSFAVDPSNPRTIYAATTVGVFKTTNGAMMWEDMTAGFESTYIVSVVINPQDPNILYAGTSGGVYKSPDGAKNWRPVNHGMIEESRVSSAMALGVNALAINPKLPNILYAGTTNGLYKTIDGGASWTLLQGKLESAFVSNLVVDYQDPHTLYAGTEHGIFKSVNEAQSWIPISQGLTNLNVRSLVMHPNDHRVLYAGTNNGIYKTTDGGMIWKSLSVLEEKNPPQESNKDANERRGG